MFDGILRLWSSRLKLHSQLYLNNCRSFSYPGPLRCVILQTANQLSCMKGHILETDIQFLQLVENSFVISLKKKILLFLYLALAFLNQCHWVAPVVELVLDKPKRSTLNQLTRMLLRQYDCGVRPVVNWTDTTVIYIDFIIQSILDVVKTPFYFCNSSVSCC